MEVRWHLEDFENDRTLVVRSDKGKDVVGGGINKGQGPDKCKTCDGNDAVCGVQRAF